MKEEYIKQIIKSKICMVRRFESKIEKLADWWSGKVLARIARHYHINSWNWWQFSQFLKTNNLSPSPCSVIYFNSIVQI